MKYAKFVKKDLLLMKEKLNFLRKKIFICRRNARIAGHNQKDNTTNLEN